MAEVADNATLSNQEKEKPKGFDSILKEKIAELKLEKNKELFKFENLVFNGGGAKCIGQVGTLEVFEELGILKKIKRFAGTSGGALTAAFAALGYTAPEIKEMLTEKNLDNLAKGGEGFFRRTWNNLTAPLTMYQKYGFYTAHAFEQWLGKIIKEADRSGGKDDVTFKQLYNHVDTHKDPPETEPCQIELAITATDIIKRQSVFYHVKTTEDVPIKTALRMSMSLPGIFSPVKIDDDDTGVFVDGGLLCNYPVMCFDGWYLSMEPKDSMFFLNNYNKSATFKGRFRAEGGGYNSKTVGVMVTAEAGDDFFKTEFHERVKGITDQPIPETEMGRKREEKVKELANETQAFRETKKKVMKFLNFAQKYIEERGDLEDDGLTKEDVENILKKAREIHKKAQKQKVHDQIGEFREQKKLDELIAVIPEITKRMDQDVLTKIKQNQEILQTAITKLGNNQVKDSEKLKYFTHELSPYAQLFATSNKNAPSDEPDAPNPADFDVLFFGKEHTATDVFKALKVPVEEKIHFNDVKKYARELKVDITDLENLNTILPVRFRNHSEYLVNIFNTMMLHASKTQMEGYDLGRTIGINTGYLDTLDFGMEEKDKEYLINQGKMGTVVFLEEKIRRP